MNPESPVTLHQIIYRGAVAYKLKWQEGGTEHEQSFPTEAEAVMETVVIEERLRIASLAGQGLTVNPFGMHTPFINSKDVHFASLKLQPRGLKFRDSIEDYVAAVNALKGQQPSVAAAVEHLVSLTHSLKSYDVSVEQAVFEWLEVKKQIGDRPFYEVLRAYLQVTAASAAAAAKTEEPSASEPPVSEPAPAPVTAPVV